ncbi:MAG: hypothetical protein AB1523_09560 [Bacillota bacterium]
MVKIRSFCRTVGEVLAALIRLHPALKDELLDEGGKLDYFYQIILNGDKVEWEQRISTLRTGTK